MSNNFKIFRLNFLLICIQIFNKLESSFVSIGNSSSYLSAGLNLLDCGLRYDPIVTNIVFTPMCFQKNYPNITYIDDSYPKTSQKGLIQTRITFGSSVEVGDSPWTVYLTEDKFLGEKPVCTGSLITLEWVLLAAHCLKIERSIFVYAGDINRKNGQRKRQIKRYIHPEYDRSTPVNYVYDIGLMKVDSKFPKSKYGNSYTINPICLPQKQEELNQFEENAIIYGFGLEEGNHPDQMRRADIRLLPANHSRCRDKLGMLCTYFENKEPRACYYDSGSGLVQQINGKQKFIVIGVTSKGVGANEKSNFCSLDNLPHTNYFAFVPGVVDWIINTVKNN